MLSLFKNTSKSIERATKEFASVKKDFDTAFVLARQQRDDLLTTKQQLEEANNKLLKANEALNISSKLLSDMAHAAGGLICRKDKDGHFLFVNEYQCVNFFGMPKSCLPYAIGKTDMDLINEYRESTGKHHSFGDICVSTDEHCKHQRIKCLYVEFGYIDDRQVILKMIKTPIFTSEGDYDGVVCFGWDISVLCTGLLDEITKGLLEETIVKLDDGIFWIKDSHRCSIPFVL